MSTKPMILLSLGAGVQSSTLALMAAHGEIEVPAAAIFADTGAEPAYVYAWLAQLETMLPFPVHRIMQGQGLAAQVLNGKRQRWTALPLYTQDTAGEIGPLRRQCTSNFKIEPIRRMVRQLSGVGLRRPKEIVVRQWIGISTDEATRMRDSGTAWIRNEYPLCDRRMSRQDCVAWLARHGYPVPPKSACTFCPYHGDREWRYLRDHDSAGWAQAVEVDTYVRDGIRGVLHRCYLHRSCQPLTAVNLDTPEEADAKRGQGTLWNMECSGMCGV